jgi:alpha-tubulin suppressor-like RCC1 family protein
MKLRAHATALAVAFVSAAATAPAVRAATPMVSSSSSHTLALKADGTVVAWGTDREGALGTGRPLVSNVPVKVAGLPKVVSLAGRNGYVLAIDGAGRVWSWGDPAGPLGPRGGVPATVPAPVAGVADVAMVGAALSYAAALRRDGTVLCWGRCPFGTTPLAGAPGIGVVTGLSDIVAIAAGDAFLALKRDGTVQAMGPNIRGSVGDGTRIARTSPVAVPGLSQVVAIAAGEQSVALRADGTVFHWGSGGYIGVTIDSPLALAGLGGPAKSIASDGINSAVRSDGTVWTWNGGLPLAQQAGIADARKAQPIDAGGRASGTLAVLGNDGVVRTVGGNFDGELGTGSAATSSSTPAAIASPAGVVALAGFRSAFLALTNAGEVWTWGFNGNLLGNAVEYDRAKPFAVPGLSNIVSVAAGQDFSLALRADGQVYSWGKAGGARGRSGARDATPTLIPGLTDIKVIAAGWDHSLFVRSNGRVL